MVKNDTVSVEWILNTIGIHPHLRGYQFIVDLVEFTYDTDSVTLKPLYDRLSAKYNVSYHSIITGIKKACESSYVSGKHLNLNTILRAEVVNKNCALTNSEVIFFISSFMKSPNYDKSAENLYKLFNDKN